MIYGFLLIFLLGAVAAGPIENMNIPVKTGFCKSPPVHPGLDSDKFFKNKWYLWRTTGTFFLGESSSCSAMESKVDGGTINLLHYQYEPMLDRFISLRGDTQKTFTSFTGLMFPVEYQAFHRFNFTVPLSVVGTDYENWAVMYFCKQMFLSKLEMSWVMVRDKEASPEENQLSEIRSSLATVDAKLEDFEVQDNSKCGDQEPHL